MRAWERTEHKPADTTPKEANGDTKGTAAAEAGSKVAATKGLDKALASRACLAASPRAGLERPGLERPEDGVGEDLPSEGNLR
jgi:peptide chain release factor subunit 3